MVSLAPNRLPFNLYAPFVGGTDRVFYCYIPNTATFQRLLHSKDCYIPKTATFQILLHSKDCYIPNTATFQILLHSEYCYTPKTVTFQILLHSKDCYIPNTATLQRLLHSKYCYIPKTATFQILLHSKYCYIPKTATFQRKVPFGTYLVSWIILGDFQGFRWSKIRFFSGLRPLTLFKSRQTSQLGGLNHGTSYCR